MKTIAMPVFENRISNRIDCSEHVLLISVENGVIDKRTLHWALAKPLEKIDLLRRLGVDVLICDGITEFYSKQLENTPIQVIPWISGQIEEVFAQFIKGKLKLTQNSQNKRRDGKKNFAFEWKGGDQNETLKKPRHGLESELPYQF